MQYRREIDGLRALAVIPVILFHAGVESFGGGFVGVDIFFVISGYLITTIILDELAAGTFSIVRFYERRARRILPALFLVMAVSFVLAWLSLLPSDMKDFSKSLVAVSVYASNFLFWIESGYFDTAAELKPLLHTWSLAVEEQFYLVFPVFLILSWRLGKKSIVALLGVASIASLAAAQWGALHQPTATFFLLHTRGWELAIGSFVALHFSRKNCYEPSLYVQQVLSLAGLALIAYATFAFGKTTPFPSLYALVPTIGTALIMLFAWPQTYVGRVLGSKPLVGIGLVSYSAYLWHQPLFAFARHRSLGEPSTAIFAGLTVLTICLAIVSWRFIERPFRRKGVIGQGQVFAFAIIGSVICVSAGVFGVLTNGFAERAMLPTGITQSFERTVRANACFDQAKVHERADWLCQLGGATAEPSFLVFGDSHALSVLEMFDSAALAENVTGVFTGASGCPPLLGIFALRIDQGDKNCHQLNRRVFDFVKEKGIRKIFLIGRWTYYTDGGYTGKEFSYLGLDPNDAKNKDISRRAFEHGVTETATRFEQLGVEVHVFTQAPQQEFAPQRAYQMVSIGGKIGNDQLALRSVASIRHRELQAYADGILREKGKYFKLFNLDQTYCTKDRCLVGDDQGSYYFDDDHLSIYGAALLTPRIRTLLR